MSIISPRMAGSADRLNELFGALSEHLAARGRDYEPVVAGGSALLALELIQRTTQDVDIVAFRQAGSLSKADPLPPDLTEACNRVASDFGLSKNGSILVRRP